MKSFSRYLMVCYAAAVAGFGFSQGSADVVLELPPQFKSHSEYFNFATKQWQEAAKEAELKGDAATAENARNNAVLYAAHARDAVTSEALGLPGFTQPTAPVATAPAASAPAAPASATPAAGSVAPAAASQPAAQPRAPRVSGLGMDAAMFVQQFNTAAAAMNAKVRLQPTQVVQGTFQHQLLPGISITGRVNGGDGGINELMILGRPDANPNVVSQLKSVYILVMGALNPGLTMEQRLAAATQLGITNVSAGSMSNRTAIGSQNYELNKNEAQGLNLIITPQQ